jgi:SAM-dependent methyltransferase
MLSVVIVLAALVAGVIWRPGFALAIVAVPCIYIAVVISVTSWRLSPQGDDIQANIHQQIVERVGDGENYLDIGCGSGELLIKLAKTWPGKFIGLDYWPGEWGQFARVQAERNARLEHVPQIAFVHGSVSRLPFSNGEFDRVVSCLTFHEVKDADNKNVSIAEAIRVVADGGRFAFVDLFDDTKIYGSRECVLAAIRDAGGRIEEQTVLSAALPLRWPMNTPKVLRYAVIISGTKRAS